MVITTATPASTASRTKNSLSVITSYSIHYTKLYDVCNIRGYAVNTVPEHTFALILALRRNVVAYRQDVIDGQWQAAQQFCFFNHSIHDLAGARLGIIGAGSLGQRVAEIGRAFGMIPLFAAHKGRSGMGGLYTPWEEVMASSDIITLRNNFV